MTRFNMYPLRANNVLEVYHQRELINLEPDYQRLSIWEMRTRQLFIDSVINGFDIPKLYLHDLVGGGRPRDRYRYAVIDGKQRMETLWDFIGNKIPLSSDFVYFDDESIDARGATYDELLERYPRLRARFDGFEIPVVLVEADDELFIEDLFSRLNEQVKLNGPEARNAMGLPLSLMIRQVARTPFFKDKLSIKNPRYQHLDLAAKFLYLTRHPGFQSTKKATLDRFVKDYREARLNGKEMASKEALSILLGDTKKVLQSMEQYFVTKDQLLRMTGRTILYYHIFKLYWRADKKVPFGKENLERFNTDVNAARLKSQRMAVGANESLSDEEHDLIAFDREKQSAGDGGAIGRQYAIFRRYAESRWDLQLLVH